VRDNGAFALGDGALTIAEILKKKGFETRAFVSALVLNRRYNLTQGFDSCDDDLWSEEEPKLFMIRDRPAWKTIDRVLQWLQNRPKQSDKKPFFAWIHLFDPHQPYRPPTWARLITPTLYDGEIAAADREIGRLTRFLEKEKILDNTLLILTSDHGESLGEHNEKTHAIFIYNATVKVPLIIRCPRFFPPGRTYDEPVHHVDIVPTVLSLLHLPGADKTQGVDLMPYIRGQKKPPERALYCESRLSELGFGMAPLYGVYNGKYKWIRAPKPELYNLVDDLHESTNLYPGEIPICRALDRELSRIFASSRRFAVPVRENPMNRETEEMLRSLGYLATSQEKKGAAGMDPKDGILIYNKLETARHLAQSDKWQQAQDILEEILVQVPGHLSARNILALVLLRQGRVEEAIRQYTRSLQDDPQQARIYAMLGNLFMLQGELDKAEHFLQHALQVSPQFVEAISNLGMIALLRGDEKTAETWYRRAVTRDAAFPHVYRRIADLYYERQDYARALRYYREALKQLPNDFRSLIQAGNCLRRIGKTDEARGSFREAARVNADSWIPYYNLACLQAAAGESSRGIASLRQALSLGFSSLKLVQEDPDLEPLRKLPEFAGIVAAVKQQLAEAPETGGDSE
jgi:Flp pilus assembly protein TadD